MALLAGSVAGRGGCCRVVRSTAPVADKTFACCCGVQFSLPIRSRRQQGSPHSKSYGRLTCFVIPALPACGVTRNLVRSRAARCRHISKVHKCPAQSHDLAILQAVCQR
jgi:hypothetical protein